MARTTWIDKLEPRERRLVEQIAVKYDAAWKAGWLSEDGFWKNPYCEGMVDALAFMGDGLDTFAVRRCVAEYCCRYGYMLGEKPEWLEEHMDCIRETWAKEDAVRTGSESGVANSRRKLHDWFRSLGFEVLAGPNPTTQWIIKPNDSDDVVFVQVKAHKDGREADYVICHRNWLPVNA